MKRLATLLCASMILAASLSAMTTVTLTGAFIPDYGQVPNLDRFLASPLGPRAFKGFEWDVAIDRVGFGGLYAVDLGKESSTVWRSDWYGIPLFASYHLFGTGDFLDPFVEAGIGCAGRVIPSGGATADTLQISLFPTLTAGLALDLKPLVVSARLNWVPGLSEIPFTSIPGYPLGGAQIVFSLGYRIGGED